MIDNTFALPSYHCQSDMWEKLKNESRPIVVYGMGNGADKLFERLALIGVSVSDIFASDGFVRGHYFRGMRVKSFSEIKEAYSDFVILLSFASNRSEVLEMLSQIDAEYDMYIPDMPVSGDEYFDKDFYNTHYEQILCAISALSDEESRRKFASIVNFKLFGRMKFLEECADTKDEIYAALPCGEIVSYLDVGAYNGDTVREAKQYFSSLKRAVAIEPDPKTYKRLLRYAEGEEEIELLTVNAAALDKDGEGSFLTGGNRNSSVNSTASFKHQSNLISYVTVDSLGEAPDFIKYDVEGAELAALEGSRQTISDHRPALLISLYHRSEDIFALINYMKQNYPFYRMCLKRVRCVPAWEIDLILTT